MSTKGVLHLQPLLWLLQLPQISHLLYLHVIKLLLLSLLWNLEINYLSIYLSSILGAQILCQVKLSTFRTVYVVNHYSWPMKGGGLLLKSLGPALTKLLWMMACKLHLMARSWGSYQQQCPIWICRENCKQFPNLV